MKILIDKQKLLDEILNSSETVRIQTSEIFIDKIKKAVPANIMIPCSERLPEEHICEDGYVEPSKYCLVYENGHYSVSRYWAHRKELLESGHDFNVWTDLIYMCPTHWIYLDDLIIEPGKEEF